MPLPVIRPQPSFASPSRSTIRVDLRTEARRVPRLGRLISRNGHIYRSFLPLRQALAKELKVKEAIFDGEIVCLDEQGRSLFNPLLFRRGNPVFAVFDLVWVDGEDLRQLPLIERKKRLRSLVPARSPHLLHVDFLAEKGTELFQLACERELEGVVGKWANGIYQDDGRSTSWVKVKNPNYSQAEGRAELFEGKGQRKRVSRAELVLR